MKKCLISFENSQKPPVELFEGEALSEHLTVQNSPILFGCRIGICGTCLIEVLDSADELPGRTETEDEFLQAVAPDRPQCRLACQLQARTDMKIQKSEL